MICVCGCTYARVCVLCVCACVLGGIMCIHDSGDCQDCLTRKFPEEKSKSNTMCNEMYWINRVLCACRAPSLLYIITRQRRVKVYNSLFLNRGWTRGRATIREWSREAAWWHFTAHVKLFNFSSLLGQFRCMRWAIVRL